MITVKLRVVGIQFHESVAVAKANPTIRDAMEAARGTAKDFNFVAAPDGSLYQASAFLPVPTPSISSGRMYDPGLYSLTDGVVGVNSVTTWQWYLIRGGVQLNQPNGVTEKFTIDSPILLDGDSIIWRLVVVATQPTIRAKTTSFDTKAERTQASNIDTISGNAKALKAPLKFRP